VKLNEPKHICHGVNKCGYAMVSHTWVVERVMEWPREDPTMGPSQLKELLKKYKMNIPYDRVFRGKEKDLDMIYGYWDDNYDLLPTYRLSFSKLCQGVLLR
jgi:hypothetical protein